ncbi:MAG: hypothetical protein AAF479_11905 [Pseudomonadota bacterium]
MSIGIRAKLDAKPEFRASIEEKFRRVLENRPLSAQEWEDGNNVDFDDDAELYEYLKRVYLFLFEAGPWPNTRDV